MEDDEASFSVQLDLFTFQSIVRPGEGFADVPFTYPPIRYTLAQENIFVGDFIRAARMFWYILFVPVFWIFLFGFYMLLPRAWSHRQQCVFISVCIYNAVAPLFAVGSLFQSSLCQEEYVDFFFTTLNSTSSMSNHNSTSYHGTTAATMSNIKPKCTGGDDFWKVCVSSGIYGFLAVSLVLTKARPKDHPGLHPGKRLLRKVANNWVTSFVLTGSLAPLMFAVSCNGAINNLLRISVPESTKDVVFAVQDLGSSLFNQPGQDIPYSEEQQSMVDQLYTMTGGLSEFAVNTFLVTCCAPLIMIMLQACLSRRIVICGGWVICALFASMSGFAFWIVLILSVNSDFFCGTTYHEFL